MSFPCERTLAAHLIERETYDPINFPSFTRINNLPTQP